MNIVYLVVVLNLFFCSTHLFSMGHNHHRHAHQQSVENDYRRYVASGVVRRNGVVLHGVQKTEFLNQLFTWAQNAGQAPNLLRKLERSAVWAKILLDRREEYQQHGLLNDDAVLKDSAKNCQTLINDLSVRYNDALNDETYRLFNHAFIWWAMLSIRRTSENFDKAWEYLDTVAMRKYLNVAKLWKAHLILINKYAPPGLPHAPLVEARNLLYPPQYQNGAGHHAGHPANLVEALGNAQIGAPHHPLLMVPPVVDQDALPNPLLAIENPAPLNAPEIPAIAPPTLQNMNALRTELREELVLQEIAANHNPPAPEAASDSEESDESDDDDSDDSDDSDDNDDNDDSDDNDNPPNAGEPAFEPNIDHDHDMEDFETSSDEDIDWATDEDENVQTFRAMLGEKELDAIDNQTFRSIKNNKIGARLKKLLAETYPEIKILGVSPDQETKPATKEAWKRREEGLPTMALIYHYSMLVDKKAASLRFLQFFTPYLPFKVPSVGALRGIYIFPGKRVDSKDRIPLFLQILAYRDEIIAGTVRVDTITQAYNKKFKAKFSNLKQASFITKKAPSKEKMLLESFKKNPEKLLAKMNEKKGKFLPTIAMLWHHLEEQDLPEKELGIAPKTVATPFIMGPEHEEFFAKIWYKIPCTKKGRNFQFVAEKFEKKFGIKCPISNAAIKSRFTRWQKKQPKAPGEATSSSKEIKASVSEKLSEHFLNKKEWLSYQAFLKIHPEHKQNCTRGVFNGVRKGLENQPEIKDVLPELKAPAADVAFVKEYLRKNFEQSNKVTFGDYKQAVPHELLLKQGSFEHYRAKVLKTMAPALQEKIKASSPPIAHARKMILESLENETSLTYQEFLKDHPDEFEPISTALFYSMKGKLKKKHAGSQNVGKKREAPSRKQPAAKKKKE
jgi:hypothetical protein